MNAEHERWVERLSDFMDGTLGTDEHDACEEHLAECGTCRLVLEELRAVVAGAQALTDRSPSRDLWPGIAAALQAPIVGEPAEHGQVIALPTAAQAPSPTRRMWSTPQLAAAAIVLMALSASMTWWASPGAAPVVAVEAGEGAVTMAGAELPGPREGLAGELQSLQGQLEALMPALDPETLLVLEQNLSVIERAIEDSRRALAQDPANEFLTEHLDRAYERKVDYLREAAEIARWSS